MDGKTNRNKKERLHGMEKERLVKDRNAPTDIHIIAVADSKIKRKIAIWR